MPRAARAPEANCAATAAMNTKHRLPAVMDRAKATEPPAGSPMAASSTVSSTNSTVLAMTATTTAEVSGA
jgi:hypothetical protein